MTGSRNMSVWMSVIANTIKYQ